MANYPYNPYYQQGYQQTYQPQQIHNGGYVSVRSEDEALMYPVAPGNSVTFINELAPYQYKKTMGFSQFDKPIFEKFRVIKEEAQNAPVSDENKNETNNVDYALKSDYEALQTQIEALKEEIKKLSEKKTSKKKEDDE